MKGFGIRKFMVFTIVTGYGSAKGMNGKQQTLNIGIIPLWAAFLNLLRFE